jgi:glycosyltransferase involved in cell wall biosynthesis
MLAKQGTRMSTRPHHLDLTRDKIVILISVFARGGCERQAYLLARELRERHGLNVEVWALKYGGDYSKEFEAAGVPTRVLEFRAPLFPCICCGVESPRWVRGVRWARRLLRVVGQLRAGGVDILLPFTTWPNVVAGLTYRLAGVRLCIWGERHAGGERVPTPERIAVRQFRRFVANSTAGVEFLAGEMRVPSERISFVPNGVEEPKIVSGTDWRTRLGLAPEQLLVVKVANVTGFKDHATLLRAWKSVQDAWSTGNRPMLALAGLCNPDEVYNECQRIVREAGIDSTVRFLGSIPDVPALLAASDLTAFSSPREGMPNGVLECMAAGRAVVASDLPGVRDALGPSGEGILVPPGDADQFARVLLNLLRDKGKRDALGEANRVRIRNEFSVQRMAERHLEVIRNSLPVASVNRRRGRELVRSEERV